MATPLADSVTANIGFASYTIAALSYLVLTTLLVASWKRGRVGAWLIAASIVTALWSASEAAEYLVGWSRSVTSVLEVVRGGVWLCFLLGVLLHTWESGRGVRLSRTLFAAVAALCVFNVAVDLASLVAQKSPHDLFGFDFSILGRLAIALAGLLLIENLFRNTRREHRWGIKYACLGIGGVFAYEFYMYSDALLFQNVNVGLADARGFVTAVIAPLIAVSAARNPEWEIEVTVSRRVIFHSATLIGAGIYLLLMAAAGFYLREFGGVWGPVVQAVFLFAAIILLGLALVSGSFRAWVKVTINKYFFTYRYDYREEWLRLIATISAVGTGRELTERVITGVADIVDSPAGALWMQRDPGQFEMASSWNSRVEAGYHAADPAFVRYLEEEQRIINLEEYRSDPEAYDDLSVPDWLNDSRESRRTWLIVPLLHHDNLLGILMLTRPRATRELNWEDYDLLKTVGRQSASYLAEQEAVRALLQARQFDEFNRRFAFVLHDIKNLVSQLSLMVKNAEKHKENPEFQDDMLQTVSESVEKMNNLLVRLHQGGRQAAATSAVDLTRFLTQYAEREKRVRGRLAFHSNVEKIVVVIDEERFGAVLSHIVDNAYDALGEQGSIEIRLGRKGRDAILEIEDEGCGMSAEFLRDELFKPFKSSKASGFGIGAFESREYVREQGGSLDVRSEPGRGTTVTIRLPAIDIADAPTHKPEPDVALP